MGTSGLNCDADLIRAYVEYTVGWSDSYNVKQKMKAYPFLCKELRGDIEINLFFIRSSPKFLSIMSNLKDYDQLAEIAVKENSDSIEYVKPEGLSSKKVYDKLAENAVNEDSWYFRSVKSEGLSSKKVYDKLA